METLMLQIALVFGGPCDLPAFDSDHWQRPAYCESVDLVWELTDKVADDMGWDRRDCNWIGTP